MLLYTYDYDDTIDTQYYSRTIYDDTIWIVPEGLLRCDIVTLEDIVKTTVRNVRKQDIAIPTYNLVLRYIRSQYQ